MFLPEFGRNLSITHTVFCGSIQRVHYARDFSLFDNMAPEPTQYEDEKTVVNAATDAFEKQFKCKPSYAAAAPGRVNLIGEHTDYCDGFVFPMALPMVTVLVGNKTDTGICRILTTAPGVDEPKYVEFPLPTAEKPLQPSEPFWANYVKGVVQHFKGAVSSFDAAVATSVPLGGGVSSSAALEVAVHTFLEALGGGERTDPTAAALTCQRAEHTFAAMPCGIMDQFIAVMGKAGHALLLDCKSMEGSLVPLTDPGLAVVITNSHVKHELSNSEYPLRKAQTEAAAAAFGVSKLREVSLQQLNENGEAGMTSVEFRRARHVVGENQRCVDGAEKLRAGNYAAFGKLMLQSHESLRDDYEVSCAELDTLVAAAMEVEGVYGARMTGGGFGGCTVTLCKAEAVPTLLEHVKSKYSGKTTFYVVKPSEGARIIQL